MPVLLYNRRYYYDANVEPVGVYMDPMLEPEARRLFVATALSTQALRRLGGHIVADSDATDLLGEARRLGEEADAIERKYRLRFDPAYPRVTAGAETVKGGLRLVLACTVFDQDSPVGVVFTSLIPGRSPQVSVAPVEAHIPNGWRPLDEMF
jgi:hypothetical protein